MAIVKFHLRRKSSTPCTLFCIRYGCCVENTKHTKNNNDKKPSFEEPKRQAMKRGDTNNDDIDDDNDNNNNNNNTVVTAVQAMSLHSGIIPLPQLLPPTTATETNDCGEQDEQVIIPSIQKRVDDYQTASTATLTDEEGETTSDDDDDDDEDDDNNDSAQQHPTLPSSLLKDFRTAIFKEQEQEQEQQHQILDPNTNVYFQKLFDDDDQLLRILLARKNEFKPALDLFWEQVRFRARWKPDQIHRDDIATALSSGAWRLCGYSKQGHVISNYKLQYWDPSAYDVDEYIQYVVYMMELILSKMPVKTQQQTTQQQNHQLDKFMIIFDVHGFSTSMIFRRNVRVMIRKLLYIAQAQYPERLLNVLLVNAPMGFESAWKLIKPLLDEKTASKITFVAGGGGRKEQQSIVMKEHIASNVLSKEYGGTHSEYELP